MSIVAIVPVANLLAANAALEASGFGPGNFSVPCFGSTGATHGALHCWPNPEFLAALQSIPNVIIGSGDVQSLIESQGAKWGDQSPVLPDIGNVTAGQVYQRDGTLWYVIQAHNRSVFGGDPNQYPALIRELRRPGQVKPWKQPIDQYDAYKLVNPFTGQPDRALFNGQEWYVTGADGAGNNVWQPGVFGWTLAT